MMADQWMGTGKSRVVVETLNRAVHDEGAPSAPLVLIIAPKSVVENRNAWRREFERYTAQTVDFLALHSGSVAQRREWADAAHRSARLAGRPLVVVMNYEAMIRGMGDWAMGASPYMVVLDEIHRIKSEKGKTSKQVAKLTQARVGVEYVVQKVIGLTGTVMPHSPMDAWAQYRALDPTCLGSNFWLYKLRYAKMQPRYVGGGRKVNQVVGYQNLDELSRKVAPITFKVPREVVLSTLPEIQHEEVAVPLEPAVRKAHEDLRADCYAELPTGEEITANSALAVGVRLRQLTSGFAVSGEVDGDPPMVSRAKLLALKDILESAGDEPVVVFGMLRCELQLLDMACELLSSTDYKVTRGYLHGGANDLEAWQRGAVQHLGVQIKAGGVGVDMTRARLAVVLNPGWSLGDYDQFQARLHRPGQRRGVTFYHLVCPDTVDRVVYQALRSQQDVVAEFARYLNANQA